MFASFEDLFAPPPICFNCEIQTRDPSDFYCTALVNDM